MADAPVLHLICGKIAAGKSTLAARLAEAPRTVLISQDDWLHALYGDELRTGADFVRLSERLQSVMSPHVAELLSAGLGVILDFPANTVDQRRWLRGLITRPGVTHQLHLIDASDALCLARLRRRNASDTHPFTVSDDMFHRFTKHFVPPRQEEGFNVVRHAAEADPASDEI